jgi:hypothetical protein
MFCSKCGAQNGDGGMFCIQCGNPLQNNQQTAAQQTPVQQDGYYANSGATPPQPGYYAPGNAAMNQTPVMTAVKKSNYTLIGIISVAAVAIVVVVVVLLLLGGKSSIVGTWTLSDYGYDMSLTFKANGTVETDSFGEKEAAKYQTKGDTLVIVDEDGYAQEGEFKISKSGGKTLLAITFDGETLTFIKK